MDQGSSNQETRAGDKKRHQIPKAAKPWENKWGHPLSDSELKAISKHWSAKEWEAYLKSCEGNLKEKTGKKWDTLQKVETFAHRGDEIFRENAQNDSAEAQSEEQEAQKFSAAPVIESEENAAIQTEADIEGAEEDRAELVRQGLEFITPSERFVLEKYFCEGWSELRIARDMRLTRSTIQAWKRRGIKKIRDRLSSVLPICERGIKTPINCENEPEMVQTSKLPEKSMTRPSFDGAGSSKESQN